MPASPLTALRAPIPFRDAIWTWCRVALLSFGGPAGQIAVMHRILVDEKKWISEERFLHALNYCMLLPGPEAQQLATYLGWLLHRTAGGLAAGLLFILPGFVSLLAFSIAYVTLQQTTVLQGLLFGLKPAVMAIVLHAVMRIGKRVLTNRTMIKLAVASFVAIYFFGVPFPIIVATAAIIGLVGGRWRPDQFCVIQAQQVATDGSTEGEAPAEARLHSVTPSLARSLRVSLICLSLWFLPLFVLAWTLGRDSTLTQEGLFFSKVSVVTFGGAYSVLAYIAQEAVERFGWLEPGEMLDGLGMAETTPGPLIMVVQFVGFMGAYRHPGPFSPIVAGVLGSLVTVWTTFVPCFYWIFLGAPYVESLRGNRLLSAALSAITASVVGVIVNLAVWFALHTLFDRVDVLRPWGFRLLVPDIHTMSLPAIAIAVIAMLLTFVWHRGMVVTLATCCLLGLLWHTYHAV